METSKKNKIFARFIAGISSAKEDEEMLKTPEIESKMIEQWESDSVPSDLPKPELYRVLASIYRKIASRHYSIRKPKIISISKTFAAAAAVVVLLLSVSSILWFGQTIAKRNMITISAPDGVNSEIFLPDGSRVWLNSGSKLTYRKSFDKPIRELKLEGEAYFNISHNSSRPMIVTTKMASVEVLGTRFNVISIPSKSRWEATLISGSIKVSPLKKDAARTIKLQPGQKAKWLIQSQDFIVENIDTENITRWVNNKLMFENQSFASIAKQLEQTFGVEIFVPHELSEYRFTAQFTDESIFEIFNLLKLTAQFDFEMQGNKVIVTTK